MRNNIHLQNVQQEKELNKFIILDSYSQFGYQDMLWNGTDDEWRNLNYFNRELNSVNLSEVLVRYVQVYYFYSVKLLIIIIYL